MNGNIKDDNLMKTTNIILTILSAMALMACNKENPAAPVSEGVFSATMETPVVTKTQLGSDGESIVWRANDQINIFAADKNEKYTTASSGTTTATFTGNPVSADTYYALYPYDAKAQMTDGKITATLPAAQTANKNNLGNNMNLAVACSNSSELSFRNVGGLIKFEIKTKNVGAVILKGNNGEDVAGKIAIDWNGGEPEYTVVDGVKEITLKPYGNKVFEIGTYHFAVLPQTFEKGITITMKPYSWATDDVVLKSYTPMDLVKSGDSPLELTRSHIKPVGPVDEGLLWEYAGVKVNCVRGTAKDSGIYIDFHSGRTFSGIGSYTYAANIDMVFVKGNLGVGFISVSGSNATSWVNAANLNKLGASTDSDLWPGQNITKGKAEFRWLSIDELTDAQYEELETTQQIKDLCTGTLAGTYFKTQSSLESYQLSNDRISAGTHEHLVFKAIEDGVTYYGVIKFSEEDHADATAHATFDYKIGR